MTRSDRRQRRRGFTLIELLVALMVGAVVVLGARLMFEGVADEAERVTRLARRTDDEANAERVLRSTVAAIDVGGAGAQPFDGDESAARFTSWCAQPGGWQERCAVTLSVTGTGGAHALLLTLGGGERVSVRAGMKRGELRYLADAHDGGRWLRSWGGGRTPPLAIGVVVDADTLVLAIGERG